jgi:cation diffusion facilitator family transporter
MTRRDPGISGLEQRALRRSVWGNLFFAALGFGFAASSQSEAILLDGFFSLVAFVLSLLTIRVAKLIEGPADDWFHFGYAAFEPMLNTIKGLLLLGICGFSLFSAIKALMHGGRALNPGWALVYAVIAASGAGLLAVLQNRAAKSTGSPLLEVDVKNWKIDSLLSTGVGIAFLAAFLLRGSEWARYLPYVDPILVVILVAIMIKDPVKIIGEGVGELLAVSPDEELQRQVRDEFARLVADYPVQSFNLRMLKAGRTYYLLAHVVVDPESHIGSIRELDDARRQIAAGLKQLHPPWEVDIVFVADPLLA